MVFIIIFNNILSSSISSSINNQENHNILCIWSQRESSLKLTTRPFLQRNGSHPRLAFTIFNFIDLYNYVASIPRDLPCISWTLNNMQCPAPWWLVFHSPWPPHNYKSIKHLNLSARLIRMHLHKWRTATCILPRMLLIMVICQRAPETINQIN